MSKVLSIARYTLVGNIRNRLFLVLILFGGLLLGASLLLGLLGQEQELRMLVDLGLGAIELLALLSAVFLIANLILEEMESRTIYLVLTRSLSRLEYLLGRFLGTLGSVFASMALMMLLHLAILLAKGWHFQAEGAVYFMSIFASFGKIFLITSIGLFFSLWSSSAVTAVAFTSFFWVLGHFAAELQFLATQIKSGAGRAAFKAVYLLVPHFQYLNLRDLWLASSAQAGFFVLRGTGYALVYGLVVLALALKVFQKKEF